MGQKVNPFAFRLGITYDWKSRWFAGGSGYAKNVIEDYKIRKYLHDKMGNAGIRDIEIIRSISSVEIKLYVLRPGIVIGRGGTGAEDLKKQLKKLSESNISITVEGVKDPELSAILTAEYIARKIEKRIHYKRAVHQSIDGALSKGAKGVKIAVAGVLSGASSISRSETYSKGSVPTQTLRADIDFGKATAKTTYGTVGIKVWIHKGEKEI